MTTEPNEPTPPPGAIDLSPADIDALEARWAHHWTPHQVAARLDGVGARWCVAAGWALDLFIGGGLRTHGDIEIAVPAGEFGPVRDRFTDLVFDGVGTNQIWPAASEEVLAATHQTWLRDPVSEDYLLDVFREPHDGDTWICRHDPTVRLPYDRIVEHTADGVPFLAPELVLLFKAKHARPKDQADFAAIAPRLGRERRATLAGLLAHTYPGHRWLAGL